MTSRDASTVARAGTTTFLDVCDTINRERRAAALAAAMRPLVQYVSRFRPEHETTGIDVDPHDGIWPVDYERRAFVRAQGVEVDEFELPAEPDAYAVEEPEAWQEYARQLADVAERMAETIADLSTSYDALGRSVSNAIEAFVLAHGDPR